MFSMLTLQIAALALLIATAGLGVVALLADEVLNGK